MTMPHEMAVTGLGVVSPLGAGVASYWRELVAGRDGFGPITLFDASHHRTRVAAELRELPAVSPKRLDPALLGRTDLMQLAAAREALAQAGLLDEATGMVSNPAMGLGSATAAGGILGLEAFFRCRHEGQACDAKPLLTSFCLSAAATNIAKEFGITGPRTTTATVCSSSGLALAAALELLRFGELDQVLVIAAESLCEVTHGGFNSLRSIAPQLCQPFDCQRQGLILGEGAGALVLERYDAARARGAEILASFAGYGLTTDLHHFTAPDPAGTAIARALQLALTDSATDPAAVGYINAHGTGTPLNDAAECQGIGAVFGSLPQLPAVSSSKSQIGHTLGGASLLEAIATVMALQSQTAPPTANLTEPEPTCGLDLVAGTGRPQPMAAAVSNSFAFGGSDISLVFKQPDGAAPVAPPAASRQTPVITGLGLVSPFGVGRGPFAQALGAGRSGLSDLAAVGPAWANLAGGLVDLAAVRERIPAKRRRHLNKLGLFLTVAVDEALADAGLAPEELADAAMAYGSAYGCSSNVHNFYTQLLSKGATVASPQEFMLSVTNAPAALVAQHLKISGPLWVMVADETSWDLTLHWAARLISHGRAERVLVAAADEISDSILAIHQGLGFLAPGRQDSLVLGEGALCLVLEAAEVAARRHAPLYGSLAAFHTEQDVACGPMQFSQSTELVKRAADCCLADLAPDRLHGLTLVGPDNGWPALTTLNEQLTTHLAPGSPLTSLTLRRLLGDSGVGSGFGLAGGLLDPAAAANSHLLTVTAGRGGIIAATLIEPARQARQHG